MFSTLTVQRKLDNFANVSRFFADFGTIVAGFSFFPMFWPITDFRRCLASFINQFEPTKRRNSLTKLRLENLHLEMGALKWGLKATLCNSLANPNLLKSGGSTVDGPFFLCFSPVTARRERKFTLQTPHLAAQCEIPLPYCTIPFRDSIAEGGITRFLLCFHVVSRFACSPRGKRREKGGYCTQAMLRHQKPP